MLHELRYAVRTLSHSPAFAAVAVLTLAVGVGANTAMFSVVDGVLLRPLAYPNAARVVQLATTDLRRGRTIARMTGPDVLDIRAGVPALERASFYAGGDMGVQVADRAEFAGVYLVSPDFFSVLGVAPIHGRAFADDDARRGAIVSLAFAQRNFGSGAAALRRPLRFEGVTYDIVGVSPAAFAFPRDAQVWLAVSPTPESMERTAFNYRAIALVRQGTSFEVANAQLQTVGARLQSAYPRENRDKTFTAVPLQEQLVGSTRSTLYFLAGAVSLLLLIACANIANLMLARATARQREIAVRAALGASRAAIVRQLLAESGVVAMAGGVIGLLLASAGTNVLSRMAFRQIGLPRVDEIHVNGAVLAFTIAMSTLASFAFGIAPAWHASRVDVNDALKQSARGIAGSSGRVRGALVVVQVALSFALAIAAALMFRSFVTLNGMDVGFRTEGILVMQAHAPAQTRDDHVRAARFFDDAGSELRKVPGVVAAAAIMGLPTGQYGSNGAYVVDGQDWATRAGHSAQANFSLTSGGYFSAMGIPLLKGRDFDSGDAIDRPPVAIVSESLARQSFPGQDPIGHTILCGLESPKWMTIVGVVGDVRQDSPAAPPVATLYMPLLQNPFHANEVEVVLRTAVAPSAIVDAVRAKVHALDPDVATRFSTLDSLVSDSIATPRLRMALVVLFAAIALVLAMAGMYGVMSYAAVQRIPEFGVRLALGASPASVMGLVLGAAARLAAVGIVIGVALAAAAGRVLQTMLFGVDAVDAATYVLVLVAVTPLVVLTAAIPAWRAARRDPLAALRTD